MAFALAYGSAAHAGTFPLYSCSFYGDAGLAFQGTDTNALKTANACGAGRYFEINQLPRTRVLSGYGVAWQTTTPSEAIKIIGVWTPQVYADCSLGKEGFFAEFRPLVPPCAYPDCTHTHEDRCAVKRAVVRRQISDQRYESYLGLFAGESAG